MIDLTVKTLDSRNHSFSLEDDQITVRGFKEHIAESVNVPADSQRLIYCGRVLQDDKKLNDYDVNGKVIHLVQRAPPQSGQRGNDSGQNQRQQRNHFWSHSPNVAHLPTGNAMYVGAMSMPAEIVEGHGLPFPQLSNTLSSGRLTIANRMLDQVNGIIDILDDPATRLNVAPSQSNNLTTSQQGAELSIEPQENDSSTNGGTRLAQAAVAVALSAEGLNNVTLLQGFSNEVFPGTTSSNDSTNAEGSTQSQSQQNDQPEDSTSGASVNPGSRPSESELPRPPQMAMLLDRLIETQNRLRPYMQRYSNLMKDDPLLQSSTESTAGSAEDSQYIVNSVSQCLHFLSHTCHAVSDIIVDMSQQPPRNLRCRPIIVQHSAIVQAGIPIQVEAHIRLHSRNPSNNNEQSHEESEQQQNQQQLAQNQSQQPEYTQSQSTHQPTGQQQPQVPLLSQVPTQQPLPQQQSHPQQQQQQQTQTTFGMFNLPSNVEVLMEVGPESTSDSTGGNDQTQESGNQNNSARPNNSGPNMFPWGAAPPPDFIRNLMQAVAGHMVQGGLTTTLPGLAATISVDNGTSTTAQSTQARSNVGTHPTTATQTRSTSRPHVFHQHSHPMASLLNFDPFLPCNSHHVRPNPSTSNSSTSTGGNQQSIRQNQSATTEGQNQSQTTSSTAPTGSATGSTTSNTSPQPASHNPVLNLLQQMLGGTVGQSQARISISHSEDELAESMEQILHGFPADHVHVQFIGESSSGEGSSNNAASNQTVAELLERRGIKFERSHDTGSRADNFLRDLGAILFRNMILSESWLLRSDQSEPFSMLRPPLQILFYSSFEDESHDDVAQCITQGLIAHLRPYLDSFITIEGRRIDVIATLENLISRHLKNAISITFDNDLSEITFARELLEIVTTLGSQICLVLRYLLGGPYEFECWVKALMRNALDRFGPNLRRWMQRALLDNFWEFIISGHGVPNSEILPLLEFCDKQYQNSLASESENQKQSEQSTPEPMDTEVIEMGQPNTQCPQRPSRPQRPPVEEPEDIPETFAGHETLPADWVPIIARDGARQRRQLQSVTNGGVSTFSDAYLGGLPSKRRKLIEQQKPRLLVSPTPNNTAITASMERLVRDGINRAGVDEVEGVAAAVASDPGVRRAFGQAIRDCINPQRHNTSDFPDPLRFPNATKYFANQDRSPK